MKRRDLLMGAGSAAVMAAVPVGAFAFDVGPPVMSYQWFRNGVPIADPRASYHVEIRAALGGEAE